MSILLPIWSTKPVTAKKVRGRIGAVLKWSIANGFRDDNPAGDAVGAALPKNGVATRHFRALPHGEVAEAALAHVVGGVEGAYARSDLFERPRMLMQTWSDYLGYPPSKE